MLRNTVYQVFESFIFDVSFIIFKCDSPAILWLLYNC